MNEQERSTLMASGITGMGFEGANT